MSEHTCINTGAVVEGRVILTPCLACQERTVEALRSAHGCLVATCDEQAARIAALEAAAAQAEMVIAALRVELAAGIVNTAKLRSVLAAYDATLAQPVGGEP